MNDLFSSVFASDLEAMIHFKESLGYARATYLAQARSFDRFCTACATQDMLLSKALVLAWVTREEQKETTGFQGRAGFIRSFGKYLNAMGKDAYTLPDAYFGGRTSFNPHIFTDAELSSLFESIDSFRCKDPFQPLLISTVYRLIYTCGLRPKEGRCLRRDAVNLQTGELLITQTKHHKERIAVMSNDMLVLTKAYARIRDAAFPDSPYFFPNRSGQLYSAAWLQENFRMFFFSANASVDPDILPRVRVYDLRHRFASAALNRWLDEKVDLTARLPYLQTYMGHKQLAATAYYIHLLPEHLVKSAGIDWTFLRGMIPEAELWEE